MALKPPRVRLTAIQLVMTILSGENRVRMAFQRSHFDREIRRQKLRRDHPEWSELQVKHEIMRQAFVHEPVPEWLEKRMKEEEDKERARRLAGLE
jgi:hypothetical protein